MRKKKFWASSFLMAAALLVTACAVEPIDEPIVEPIGEEEIPAGEKRVVTLRATLLPDVETKTERQSDGKVFWTLWDDLSVFVVGEDNPDRGYCFGYYPEDYPINPGNDFDWNTFYLNINFDDYPPSATADFICYDEIPENLSLETKDLWAIYPYYNDHLFIQNGDTQYARIYLSESQLSGENTFGYGQFPTIGHSTGLNMGFYNICGGIRFTVSHDNIQEVTFRNIDGYPISGYYDVSFNDDGFPQAAFTGYDELIADGEDLSWASSITVRPESDNPFEPGVEYYVIIPPVRMTQGLEVTYTNTSSLSASIIVGTANGGLTINRGHFPSLTARDANLPFIPDGAITFKRWCCDVFEVSNYSDISQDLKNEADVLDLSSTNLYDLDGIKDFRNLQTLYCNSNLISSIDVSGMTNLQELQCQNNSLTSLDVSGCSSLTQLVCDNNSLTTLDISECSSLTYLEAYNNSLTTIDISGSSLLTYLDLFNNSLTTLDISSLGNLSFLDCDENPGLTLTMRIGQNISQFYYYSDITFEYVNPYEDSGIDLEFLIYLLANGYLYDVDGELSGFNECTVLYLQDQGFSSIAGIEKFTNLSSLYCDNNKLVELDLSGCSSLEYLRCFKNSLSTLNVTGCTSLSTLECYTNNLSALDLTGCTSLSTLECYNNNNLSALDLTGCTSLSTLKCYNNSLSALDLSDCSSLTYLDCADNGLSALDLSSSTNLTYIDCSNNDIMSLDVTGLTRSCTLICTGNENLTLTLRFDQTVYLTSDSDINVVCVGGSAPDPVDLGLSVNWAPYNVGATSASSAGRVFGKPNFKVELELLKWGDGWRVPTQAEYRELLNYCTMTWDNVENVNGCRYTAPNGNSIFLPRSYDSNGRDYAHYLVKDDEEESYLQLAFFKYPNSNTPPYFVTNSSYFDDANLRLVKDKPGGSIADYPVNNLEW